VKYLFPENSANEFNTPIKSPHFPPLLIRKPPSPILPFIIAGRIVCRSRKFLAFTVVRGIGRENFMWGGREDHVDAQFVKGFADATGFSGKGVAGLRWC